ncbi:MAG: hypothetical protein LBP59_18435 [Planctomycetaceae bacterium]|nr:hypothetical protein [Planctomycetaceae bacterium]
MSTTACMRNACVPANNFLLPLVVDFFLCRILPVVFLNYSYFNFRLHSLA